MSRKARSGSDEQNPRAAMCREPYPKGELFCVKEPGHAGKHATLLGIHPEHEDGWGNLWPEQEEWAEWE